MTRRRFHHLVSRNTLLPVLLLSSLLAAGCSTKAETAPDAAKATEPLAIATTAVESRPIDRYLRVTGSLMADAQAEVSAETAGRVIATPVERGTRVAEGALLFGSRRRRRRRSSRKRRPTRRRSKRALGSTPRRPFDRTRVPDVMNAKASLDLAEAEFNRMKSLLDQKVISQSEFDQRRTQLEAARQNYQAAQNMADQSYRSLEAARARMTLAQKAVADTAVRAPLLGLVAERLVSRRRLRHARTEGRDRRPRGSAQGRADGSRAARLARQGRPAGAAHRRRVPRRGVRGDDPVRVAGAALRSARADRGSHRREPRWPAQAGPLRDGARAPAGRRAGAARARRPLSKRSQARAASTSSSRTTRSKSAS